MGNKPNSNAALLAAFDASCAANRDLADSLGKGMYHLALEASARQKLAEQSGDVVGVNILRFAQEGIGVHLMRLTGAENQEIDDDKD